MNPGIFLIQDNEELIEMTEQTYESEKLLQSWLAQYPALLVGNQIDAKEPKRFTQERSLEKFLDAIEWSNDQVKNQPK